MAGGGNNAPSGMEVRSILIGYLTDSLRALNDDAYLYLPKIPVIPDWAGWEDEVEPNRNGDELQFQFMYWTSLPPAGDAYGLCTQLSSVWRSWGWTCSTHDGGDHYDFIATSPDEFRLSAYGTSRLGNFTLMVSSPTFEGSS